MPSRIQHLHQLFLGCNGISIDTRQLKPNQMFAAIRGDRFDGHAFVEEAIEKGAKFCLVDDMALATEPKCYHVPNVLMALQRLAHYHRLQHRLPVLAITGSNGKTTTKELIYSVLAEKMKVLATIGNLNNHIGVPLTLLRLRSDHEIAIIEMGANHVGEINWLCHITAPTHGLVTNLGLAHLEGFGGVEGIRRGKFELYHYLYGRAGIGFFNQEEPSLAGVNALFPGLQSYGLEDLPGEIQKVDFGSSEHPIVIRLANGLSRKTHLSGAFNQNNILTAVAIGAYFKLTREMIEDGICNYQPTNNRSQRRIIGTNEFFLDAYNANPTSVKQAIKFFDNIDGKNKVLILGDMLELGDVAVSSHQEVLKSALAVDGLKSLYLVGQIFSSLEIADSKVVQFLNVEALVEHLNEYGINQCQVLVKGSRGIQLEKIWTD